ncbi:trypsin epsilon-like [Bacillus rossius redtenbacheri]|uniref:trypsin epsilon-like n=1 Tax=Bacillus rossius redtenbacheri TaxID=93214 RepID=UPI002FDD30A5
MLFAAVLLALGTRFHDVKGHPLEKRVLGADDSTAKENMYKILNGEPAKPGEYPFAVSLEVAGQHFCGGTVVSQYWVVSAAHCFPTPNMRSLVQVRAGVTSQGRGGTLHHVDQVVSHPEYNEPSLYNNDIALLKVKEPFTEAAVRPARLADHRDLLDQGTDVVSAGWGITTKDGSGGPSPDLLEVSLTVVDRKKCNRLPGISHLYEVGGLVVTENMICARARDKDTTKGDSGGPLLRREGGDLVLVGVVSWGEGQGSWDSPGVYTDVAKYEKWIYWTTREDGAHTEPSFAADE